MCSMVFTGYYQIEHLDGPVFLTEFQEIVRRFSKEFQSFIWSENSLEIGNLGAILEKTINDPRIIIFKC